MQSESDHRFSQHYAYEVHIGFTATGATMLRWVNPPGSVSLRFSKNNGASWTYSTCHSYWYVREAGDYLISFMDEPPNVKFGGGLVSLAEEFTKVKLYPEFKPKDLDMSNMFRDCNSLVTIDMDVDVLASSQNPSDMFGPKIWDDFAIYQLGDMVIHADQLYVADRVTSSVEPGNNDAWVVIDSDSASAPAVSSIDAETREALDTTMKDIDDIPE